MVYLVTRYNRKRTVAACAKECDAQFLARHAYNGAAVVAVPLTPDEAKRRYRSRFVA